MNLENKGKNKKYLKPIQNLLELNSKNNKFY
jgi:hypothetical protein